MAGSSKYAWPLQVFFDGACPICSREIAFTRRRDRLHHIEFIDIAGVEFDAAAHGLALQRLNEKMHAKGADGRVYIGVEAFRQIARALPASLLTLGFRGLLHIPGVMWIARLYYSWFAKNRLRLGGRCTAETCSIK